MKQYRWQVILGTSLILLSACIYFIHYLIFKDTRHIFIYLFGDIAFVPINVLLVTLFINKLLSVREKRSMFKKLNMVIGAFFSEVGTELLKCFSLFDSDPCKISEDLIVTNDWSKREYSDIENRIKNYNYQIDSKKGDLQLLRSFLIEKRDFLLRLLENPNLLEHASFTELLWAVFHLNEELFKRNNVKNLSIADYEHLSGDIKRAYTLLISEWLNYMKHLKDDYPYLFSLALRTNPFNPIASVEIK